MHGLDPAAIELRAPDNSNGSQACEHFVQLYDDDLSLVDSIATFVSVGIGRGEAAIVVADPPHIEQLNNYLGKRIDLQGARFPGSYRTVDAGELVGRFMSNEMPDPDRFRSSVGSLIEQASNGGRGVRVFGEMVSLLWEQGNVAGALNLEDLWNELSESIRFKLFCAYPTHIFGRRNAAPLHAICERHSHVILAPQTATG